MTIVASTPATRCEVESIDGRCISGGGFDADGGRGYDVRFQEGWLITEAGVGSPGVVAVELCPTSAAENQGQVTTTTTTEDIDAGFHLTRTVCRALDASGRAVICAEVLMDPIRGRGATQVWCLWWPQNCIGGDESDWNGACDEEEEEKEEPEEDKGKGKGKGKKVGASHVDDVSPRPLGNLREHLTNALSSVSSPRVS